MKSSDQANSQPLEPVRHASRSSLPRVVLLAAAAIVIAALHFAREVFIPVAFSMLLSFLLAPLVSRLERLRVGHITAVIAVVFLVVAGMGTLGWFVLGQFTGLVDRLPEYRHALTERVDEVRLRLGERFGEAAAIVEEIGEDLEAETSPPASDVVRVELAEGPWSATAMLKGALWPAIGALGFLGIVALFVTFMLLQRADLRDRFIWMIGDDRLNVTTQMIEEASSRVSRYLFAQFLINGSQGVLVAVGLTLLGVPDALLWGLVSALLRFIPYIGPWIAALCPILISFAVFDGWTRPLATVGLFLVLELFSNNVIEPYMYAAKTGMSSLAILVAALFWTWLWGGLGLVLATPLTVCLVVMGKYVPQLRAFSVVLGDRPVLSMAARLYQRLLANDHDGAWEVLASQLKDHPLVEVYDELMLPALAMAARDGRSGEVDALRRQEIQRDLSALAEEAAEHHEQLRRGTAEDEAVAVAPAGQNERALRLLCLPTSDQADETAAAMLCQVLRADGVECELLSSVALAGEVLSTLDQREVDALCISHVPPPALAPIRYLCKRLVDKHPDLPVVIGAWTLQLEDKDADLRLPRSGRLLVATTLAEARAHALQLSAEVRVASRPGVAGNRESSTLGARRGA